MIDAQNRAAARLQFIVMALMLQFLLGEDGCIEGKCTVGIRIRTGDSKSRFAA